MHAKTSRFENNIVCDADRGGALYDDPLDEDLSGDLVVTTTRRALCRLTLLATQVGGRFERDGEAVDPMAWLLAPRALFNGQAAIDACLRRDHFLRALILHGLAMGLDAHPAQIDTLMENEGFSSAEPSEPDPDTVSDILLPDDKDTHGGSPRGSSRLVQVEP